MKYGGLFAIISLFLTPIDCLSLNDVGDSLQKCLTELNLNNDDLNSLENALMSSSEPTHNGKCLASCTVQKAGMIKDGKINRDAVTGLDPSASVIDFGQCVDVTGSDDCEKDYNILKCCVQQYITKTNLKLSR